MRRLWRIALIVLALAAFGAAAWFRPGFTPPMRFSDLFTGAGRSVATLEKVRLGGVDQWLLVRGADTSKPIVLMLHGDPGRPEIYMAHAFQGPLERDFVMVQWDRRGSGKSYYDDPDRPILASQETADAIELIGLLQRRFGPRRVILVGHSYGTLIGVALARTRPDLVRAYVGVAQEACTVEDAHAIQDSWIRRQAALRGDTRTQALATAGGDWDRRAAIMAFGGEMIGMAGPLPFALMAVSAPEYNLRDAVNVGNDWAYDHAHTIYDGPEPPLARSVPALAVPAYFFLGRRDELAPTLCAERYAEVLQAPKVDVVWFEHSAHFPFLSEPEAFRQALLRVAAETAERG